MEPTIFIKQKQQNGNVASEILDLVAPKTGLGNIPFKCENGVKIIFGYSKQRRDFRENWWKERIN